MRRVLQLYIKETKKRWGDIFFSMEYHVYWWLKSSCFEFAGGGKYGIFEPKSWWKYDIYWLLKSSCFDHFGNGKYGLFWAKRLMERRYLIFTGYWRVLVLNFSVMGNTVFFWVKKLMQRWYLLVNEKFLFWTFRWCKIRSFFQSKSSWKDDIYLIFLSFPWYSRTWEIWFFAQCPFIFIPLHGYYSSIPLLYEDYIPRIPTLTSPAFSPWFPAFPHWFTAFISFPPWFPAFRSFSPFRSRFPIPAFTDSPIKNTFLT